MASDLLDQGAAALKEGRWTDARAAYEAGLSESESAEALNGIAEATWWLCEAKESIRFRERAFVASLREDRVDRACMTAVNLSIAYLANLGNEPAARGWLAKAERLVGEVDDVAVRGWVILMGGYMAPDGAEAMKRMSEAVQHARQGGDVDLELVALSDIGLTMVRAGKPEEGMALLDEAMAGTLAGQYSRLDTVVFTSCNMLAACSLTGDVARAAQWCRVADDFMRTYSCPFLFSRCRVHYGSVLVAKGRWRDAEVELQAALNMAGDVGPGPVAEAVTRLADLHLKQGRIEEAAALLDGADLVTAALPAAAIQLAGGRPDLAVALLERRVEQLGATDPDAAPALALLVDAHLAAGDAEAAARRAADIRSIAEARTGSSAGAYLALASAHLAAARGDADGDTQRVRELERALERFTSLDLPLETGRVRLELAQALAPARRALATVEAQAALDAFEQIGATPDADRAAAFLRSLGVAGRTGPKNVGLLTRREQEVLQLVGIGLSNPEIAARLFISRKTAAHHVSNLLMKLGLRNRAEAVAYAARADR